MKSYFLISFIILSLFALFSSQRICTNCYNASTGNTYQCNGYQCQAFLWPVNMSYPYSVNCKQTSSSSCYYPAGLDPASRLYKYIACNYTLKDCAYCNGMDDCSSCYRGSYLYYTNIDNSWRQCKKCNQNINGCLLCNSDGSRCDQCNSNYLLLSGMCYQKDGKTLAGRDEDISSSAMRGIQIGVIIAAVFISIGVIGFLYGVYMWTKKSKYQPLLQGGQN